MEDDKIMAHFKESINETLKYPRTMLKTVGCYMKPGGGFNVVCLYVVFVMLCYFNLTTFYAMYDEWPDLPKMAINGSPFIGSFAATLKFANYMIHRNHFESLINTIENDFWAKNENSPDTEKAMLYKYSYIAMQLTAFQTILMFIVGPMWMVKPLYTMYILPLITSTKSPGRALPFKTWAPFHLDAYADPLYQVFYLLQCIALLTTLAMLATMDCLVVIPVVNTAAQFKLIQMRLENCKFQKINKDIDEPFHTGETDINNCIIHHQKLCKLCYDLEQSLTLPIFYECITVCLFLCMSGFIVTVFQGDFFVKIQQIVALVAALAQLYLYCLSADELTTQAIEVANAAYKCDWFDAPDSVKQSIIYIMMRAQKPIYLTAGKFAPVSIETFQIVTRTAFSYFTVLSAVNEEK